MADSEAKFSINLESNAGKVSDEAAASLDHLRERIQAGEASLKEMGGALRRLRGSTQEVKDAKVELKAKIDAEKNALSAANLALVKAGIGYDALAAKKKKAAVDKETATKERTSALANAMRAAGGPAATLQARLEALKSVAGGAGAGLGLVTLAVAGTVAAFVALAAAGAAAAASALKFVFGGANAARSANLLRQATSGTAENAAALGTHVDLLATKVPTAKGALNELAASLMKNRLSGETTIDTFNAIAQASAGLGDDVGNKVKELVTRGQITQRFQLNPYELVGSGLEFEDVAKSLAEQMHVGVGQARAALFEGRVKLGDGAKALRTAVEKKVGGVNLAKMMDLDVLRLKLGETLEKLTSGVKIEPLLRGFSKLAELFSETSVTGAGLKELITTIGSGLATSFEGAVPTIKAAIQGLIIGALRMGTAFLKVRRTLKETFGDKETLSSADTIKAALVVGEYAAMGMAAGLTISAISLTAMVTAAGKVAKTLTDLKKQVASDDWKGLGLSVTKGIALGLDLGSVSVVGAITALAKKMAGAFTRENEIRSPSRKFRRLTREVPAGSVEGLEEGTPDVQRAAAEMLRVPALPSGRGGGGGRAAQGGGAPIEVNVVIQVAAGAGAQETARAFQEPSVMGKIVQVFRDAAVAAGRPVPA